jgi:hypothetical protein
MTYALIEEHLTPTGKMKKKQPGSRSLFPAPLKARKHAEQNHGASLEWSKVSKGEWVAEAPGIRYRVKRDIDF